MRTKLFIGCFFILSLSLTAFSQDCYTVIKVKGSVFNSSKGKDISANDRLCSNENIVFGSPNSVLIVHSVDKGRFTLKPKSNTSKSELSFLVNDVLSSGSERLSSRGPSSLSEEFTGDYFVIGSLNYPVADKDYPLNENTEFHVKYFCKNDSVENKLLSVSNYLIFSKKTVYTVKGQPVNQDNINKVSLYYCDKRNKTSILVCSFNLKFLEDGQMQDEINYINNYYKNSGKAGDALFEEILSYVNDAYGKVNYENFELWYKNNF